MVKITEQLLEQGKSSRGAWSNKQLKALGLKEGFNFNKGWKYKLIGKMVSKEQVNTFLALKDAHLKNKQGHYKPNDNILFDKYCLPEERKPDIWAGTHKYNCSTCIHGVTGSCTDGDANSLCGYYYSLDGTMHGIELSRQESKEEELPLFAGV